jgi:hypothetical protein
MKPRARRGLLALGLLGCLLLAADPAGSQCAMCRSALENSAEGRAISASLGRAILVLLAAPYLVVTAFASVLFRDRIVRFLRRLVPGGARSSAPTTPGPPAPLL